MRLSRGEEFFFRMFPVWIFIAFMAGATIIRFGIDPMFHYQENVCTYKGGQVEGEWCILGEGRVAITLDKLAPKDK